jgi:hypothetical protein
MTIDERLQVLAMHLEALTRVYEDFEKRMMDCARDVKDAITRLTNVATAHR